MPLVLTSADTLVAYLDASKTTNSLSYYIGYGDTNGTVMAEGRNFGNNLNHTSGSPLTIVSSPASNYNRLIANLSIYNADTVAHQIYVCFYNAVAYPLCVQWIQPGQSLLFDGARWSASGDALSTQPGLIAYVGKNTAPVGWLKCDGTSYLRVTYPNLFDVISTTFGAADGTHFNVPDLQGQFIRCWADSGVTYDSGRTFASTQADAFQLHGHESGYSLGGGTPTYGIFSTFGAKSGDLASAPSTYGGGGTPRTATETRPRNFALLAIIKY